MTSAAAAFFKALYWMVVGAAVGEHPHVAAVLGCAIIAYATIGSGMETLVMKRFLLATVAAITLATGAHATTVAEAVAEYKQTIKGLLDKAQENCPGDCAKTFVVLVAKPHLDVEVQAVVRLCKAQVAKGEAIGIPSCDQLQEWTEDAIAEWVVQP